MGGSAEVKKLFGVKMDDDITAAAVKSADSLMLLASHAKIVGEEFKKSQVGALTIKMKDARKIFKDVGGSILQFKKYLKDAGISSLDASILVNRMTHEVREQRRAAMGMEGLWAKIFNPRTIWIASHSLNVLSKGFGVMKTLAGGVAGVVGGIAEKSLDVGRGLLETIVDSARVREDTMVAFREMLHGSKEEREAQAQDLYKFAVDAATQTPLDTDKIIEYLKDLTKGGFAPDESKVLLGVVADQQAKLGKGDETIAILSRMKEGVIATAETMEGLRAAGFQLEPIYEELAKKLGIHDEDPLKLVAKVRKRLGQTANPVGGYTVMNALIAAQEKSSGGLSGSFAVANSKTLSGVISNVKSSFGDLIKQMDVGRWPGVEKLKSALLLVTDEMTRADGAGQLLLAGVKQFVDETMGGLGNIKREDLAGIFKRAGDALRWVAEQVKQAWLWFDKLVHAQEGSFLETLGDTLMDVGAYIGAGIWKGIKGGAGSAREERIEKQTGIPYANIAVAAQARGVDADMFARTFATSYDKWQKATGGESSVKHGLLSFGNNKDYETIDAVMDWQKTQAVQQAAQQGIDLVRGLLQGVKQEGKIQSPSRAMAEEGRQLVRGLVGGVRQEGERAGGGAAGGISVEVNVYGAGADGQRLGQYIAREVRRELTSFVERAADEGG